MAISQDERDGASIVLQANEDIGGDQSQQWAEFDAFRDQGDASAAGMSVWVYRIPTNAAGEPDGSESRQLFTAPIDRYTLQQIFERVKKGFMPRGHGTATIRIMVRRDKVRGVIWQKLFIIEKSSFDDEPEVGAKPADSGIAALAEAMRQQNQLIVQLITRQQNAPAQPVGDPVEQALKMVGAMTGMMGVLAAKTAPAGPAAAGVGDMISGIREMMKLTKEIGGMSGESGGGGDDNDGSAVGVLKAIAPIADLVKTLIVTGRQNPALTAPVPQLAGPRPEPMPMQPSWEKGSAIPMPARQPYPPAAESFSTGNPEGDKAMFAKVTEILGDLVKLAENGSNPADLGSTVVDLIPEAYDEHFYNILAAPNWLDKLAAFNPAVRSQAEWFTKLREAALAEYADDNAAEIVASNQPGV